MFRPAALLAVAFTGMTLGTPAVEARSRQAGAAETPSVVEPSDSRSRYCTTFGPNDFGNFAGALPRQPQNAFPDYHGECPVWAPYEATGTAYW
jgi:hypothetical protein